MKQNQYGCGIGGLFAAIMILCGTAQATTYYWDNTSPIESNGFGTAGGTWGVDAFWSTSNQGTTTPGTTTTTSGDEVDFGTDTASYGLATGTVSVSGSVICSNIIVGLKSGAITISGGTITNYGAFNNKSTSTLTFGSAVVLAGTLGARGLGNGNITFGTVNNSGGGYLSTGTGTYTFQGSGNAGIYPNGGLVLVGADGLTLGGIQFQGTVNPTRTFSLNGHSVTILGLSSGGTSTQTVTDISSGSGTSTLTVSSDSPTGNNAYSVTITDGASKKIALVKSGSNANGNLQLGMPNTYSGNTLVTFGKITLNTNLAIQSSAIDTSGAGKFALGTGITTPTVGGLIGSRNLSSVFDTSYSNMTALTLNSFAGQTNSYSGNITEGATGMTLTKRGSGTQILAGTNTFTGGTVVSNGTLLVDGVITSSCPVTVTLNGVLGGGGSVGVVTNYGKIVATITNVNGGASGGCAYLHATGAVTLEPGCRFSLSDPNNYLQTSAGPYTVLSATGGITPNGFGSNLDNVPNGWQIQYQGTSIILKKGSFNGMVIRIH